MFDVALQINPNYYDAYSKKGLYFVLNLALLVFLSNRKEEGI